MSKYIVLTTTTVAVLVWALVLIVSDYDGRAERAAWVAFSVVLAMWTAMLVVTIMRETGERR